MFAMRGRTRPSSKKRTYVRLKKIRTLPYADVKKGQNPPCQRSLKDTIPPNKNGQNPPNYGRIKGDTGNGYRPYFMHK